MQSDTTSRLAELLWTAADRRRYAPSRRVRTPVEPAAAIDSRDDG